MPIDTTWLYSIPILLIALAALFIIAAIWDARSRARRSSPGSIAYAEEPKGDCPL